MIADAGTIERLWPRVAALARRSRYAVAALDQVALSLFGFALNLCLVRILSATDFGIVSLWLAVSQLAIGVQNALVNGPLSVYPPAARDPQAARRLEASLALVNLLTIAAATLAVAAANLASNADWARHDPPTALAIPLFIGFVLAREYYRSIAYSRHDMAMLLWTDLPYLAATGLCLAAIMLWPVRSMALAAVFGAMSLGSAAGQLCLRWRRSRAIPLRFRRGALAPYRGIAGEVSWSLVGVVANHVETRSYTYITTTMVSLAALAGLNIVGVLFRPTEVLIGAWVRAALPQLSGFLARGETGAFDRLLGRALVLTAAGSIAWYGALLAGWGPVEHYVLAGKYPEAGALLLPWAAASGFSLLRYVAGMGLIAARQFKFLAYAQIGCGTIAAAATVGMILWQGYTGAMWGIAIGNGACLVLSLIRLRTVRRPGFLASRPQWDAGAAPPRGNM